MPLPSCVRINVDDHRSAAALVDDGWREIEVLNKWYRRPGPVDEYFCCEGVKGRDAVPSDRGQCQMIAVASFKFDRLHADPEVDDIEADQVRVRWVQGAFDGNAIIYVADYQDKVVAFIILVDDNCLRRIDLIAVHPHWFKRGLASQLLAIAANNSPYGLEAGTQESNSPARNLYSSAGFLVTNSLRTFHK